MTRLARSAAADVVWRQAVVTRKYALAPIRDALTREGRRPVWLRGQLEERVGIRLSRATLSSYLHGYARIPRTVLSAACWIAGAQERDVLARVPDEAVLIQQPAQRRKSGRNPANKRHAASA